MVWHQPSIPHRPVDPSYTEQIELLFAVVTLKLSTISFRSFSVSGPTIWNAVPDYLRNPTLPTDVFKSQPIQKLSYLLIINTTL